MGSRTEQPSRPMWVVDGMNLIGSRAGGWWRDPDRAVRALVEEMEEHADRTGEAITIVFDYRPRGLRVGTAGGVKVRFGSGEPQAADTMIIGMVEEHPDPSTLRVVTSDKVLREVVEGAGAPVVSVSEFRRRLEGGEEVD